MSSESNNNTLTIKFVRKDGSIQEVRVPEGMTLMEALVSLLNHQLMKYLPIVVGVVRVELATLIYEKILTKWEE